MNDAIFDGAGHAVIVAAERGGVRKTSTVSALVAHLLQTATEIDVVQIDDQSALVAAFGDRVTTVRMPSAEALRTDDLADAVALDPLFSQLLDGKGRFTVVDAGANVDARLFDAAAAIDLDFELASRGTAVTALVPMTTDPDSVLLATRTIKRVMAALPSARIVPTFCDDGGSWNSLGSAAAQKAYDKTVAPLAKTASLTHPRLLPRVIAALARTAVPAWRIPDMPIHEIVTELREPPILARYIRGDLTVWRARMADDFEVLFGL